MDKKRISFFTTTISFVTLFLVFLSIASAEVVVYDDVTTIGKSIKLKALTKGKLFPEGGKLVKFYVNGKHISTTLSGGDGYAFLEYLPHSPGIKKLKVEKDTEIDEGILLVTDKNDKVLLIEIENTLFVPEFLNLLQPVNPVREGISNGVKQSKEALQKLSKKFRIIYLTTMMGIKKSKEWLKENDFPISAILKWTGPDMLAELKEREVKLYAIIGSPAVLAEASDIKNRFSFEDTEDGVVVKNWDELLKKLK